TKSGTNQYHGNAIWFWNGSSMNGNAWFNNAAGVEKPFANNNQWAASFGGPIKKDKLFFFANTEGIRFILPASSTVFAWSPAYINSSLAAVAATNPAELPLYQQYYQIMQNGPGYAGNAGSAATNPLGQGCASIATNCIFPYVTNGSQN